MMPGTIVLLTHASDETDDRASAWLKRQGWTTQWVCPADGEVLPDPSHGIAAAVVYGGRFDVDQQDRSPFLKHELAWIAAALERNIPLLGLCLGAQLIAHVLGARVGPHPQGFAEYGYYPLIPEGEGEKLFGESLTVLQSHWHGWWDTPRGAERLGMSALFPQQAFRYGSNAYGFQFHPEASLATLSRWVARRGERNFLPGAHPPERQIADHAIYDDALGAWFEAFLGRWIGSPAERREAAE
jgi:GMP synthase (glutamine-hydrolysing)